MSASSFENALLAEVGLDVRLENFEGPLDLLLYLIKKNDLDVYDIPIAHITQEYLGYLDLMQELNLEVAGGFLVMASTLMQIKAQMLLPSPDPEAEEGPDPRTELMNKLLEYQQYKEAASLLTGFNERAKDVFYRRTVPHFGQDEYFLRSSVFDLLEAFKRVLDQAPREVGQVLREEIPLEVKIREVLDRLADATSLSFFDLFPPEAKRIQRIVTFLALLELIRLKQIVAMQADVFSEIRIYRADAAPLAVTPEADAEAPPAPSPLSDEAQPILPRLSPIESASIDSLTESMAASAPEPVEMENQAAEPGVTSPDPAATLDDSLISPQSSSDAVDPNSETSHGNE